MKNIITEQELNESLDQMYNESFRKRVYLYKQVEIAAMDCFISKRSDIHSERIRITVKSLKERGVFPWV